MVCITMPDFLSYPRVLETSELPELNGRLSYFCKYYGYYGYSALINRSNDNVGLILGDFDGNKFEQERPRDKQFLAFREFILGNLPKIVSVMKFANISKAQYYFSHDEERYRLVDVRSDLNKLLSPGMIKDVFGKQLDIQEYVHIGEFSEIELAKVTYRPLIIKPNTFKTVVRDDEMLPCYGIIVK